MCMSRTLRFFTAFFLCAVLSCLSFSAGTADELSESREVLQLSNSEDILFFFSDCALLADRGLTNSPFAGSADEIILDSLTHSTELCKYLGISKDQIAILSRSENTLLTQDQEDDSRKINFIFDDEYALAARDRLDQLMDDKHKMKLAFLYLDFEGLMAIRRRQFRNLIEISLDDQMEVVRIANEYVDSKSAAAKVLHKRIFTLQQEKLQLLPRLNLELRQLSSELDHKIANALSKDQRERLAAIVVQAMKVTDLIQGPGVGRPWQSSIQRDGD